MLHFNGWSIIINKLQYLYYNYYYIYNIIYGYNLFIHPTRYNKLVYIKNESEIERLRAFINNSASVLSKITQRMQRLCAVSGSTQCSLDSVGRGRVISYYVITHSRSACRLVCSQVKRALCRPYYRCPSSRTHRFFACNFSSVIMTDAACLVWSIFGHCDRQSRERVYLTFCLGYVSG